MSNSVLIHWRALCILYGSLLASIAFAVGHHFYYQKLNNRTVSTENELAIGPWAGVQSQKFNTAVGTTLASSFRTSLSITVTTAYCQIVWHALMAEKTKLHVVDAISGILANPIGFLNLEAWRKSALLFPLAITIWLLPIAPIITPATLTVATNPQISQSKVNVTSIDFNSLNFAQLRLDPSQAELESQIVCGWAYGGPTAEVQKVVTAAAVPGAEILITAPGDQRNASYVQQFTAPALQCSDVTDPTDPVRRGLVSNVNTSSWNNGQSYGFVAWAPSSNNPLPFEPTENNEENQVNPTEIGPEDGPLTLFVATFPDNLDPDGEGRGNNFTDSSLIKCTLMNATYSLSFSWTDSIQDLNVTVTPQNNISYPPQITCDHYLFTNNSQDGQALGLAQPLSDFNNTIIQNYAYASVLEAFSNLFKGTISSQGTSSSNVMNTIIGSTAELIALQNDAAKSTAVYGMQGLPPGTWPDVSASERNNDPPSLRPTLELLFRNATLRMMTSPLLQPDPRTPYFPQPMEVTTIVYRNVYAYSAMMLWLAYGAALLVAMVTVVAGSLAIFSSDISYSSSFSTVLRTASHASVSTKISREDAVGQDPLPKHLAEATITFEHAVRAGVLEVEAATQLLEPKGGFELRPVSDGSEGDSTWSSLHGRTRSSLLQD